MIFNILASLFLIVMSFVIRNIAEPSITTTLITWSMFFVGLILLGIFLYMLFFKTKRRKQNDN